MNKFAIIVATFNRPKSLQRLLNSLVTADYLNDSIDLVISIDYEKSNNHDQVCEIANKIQWMHGNKIINIEEKNIGLKKHILQCGEYTNKYDAIIVLEDDLLVSKYFYSYAKQAYEYYKNDIKIAGISLYNHSINVNCNRIFTPLKTGCDSYFMQFAQSWGQVWYKSAWDEFIKWYDNYIGEFGTDKIPESVSNWSEKSWLKWHIKYLIENEKYFVYPYVSLTTNFTEAGTHNLVQNNDYQVPMQFQDQIYKFEEISESLAIYDAFFENKSLSKILQQSSVESDLYASKKCYTAKYVITSKKFEGVNPIKSYSLQLRPHEANIIYKIEGNHFFMYQTDQIKGLTQQKNQQNQIVESLYDLKTTNFRKSLKLLEHFFAQRIKRR